MGNAVSVAPGCYQAEIEGIFNVGVLSTHLLDPFSKEGEAISLCPLPGV